MEAENDQLVDQRGSQESEASPAATGCEHHRVEQRKPAQVAQAAHKFVIFHDRQIWKTAQCVEGRASDEQCLVAIGHPPQARAQIGQGLNQPATAKRFADFETERTADHIRLAKKPRRQSRALKWDAAFTAGR